MLSFDGTGPFGKGPMTGCGRGYCVLPISTPKQVQLKQVRVRIKGVNPIKEVHHTRI